MAARGVAVGGLAQALASASGFIFFLDVARHLGVAATGTFALTYTLITFVSATNRAGLADALIVQPPSLASAAASLRRQGQLLMLFGMTALMSPFVVLLMPASPAAATALATLGLLAAVDFARPLLIADGRAGRAVAGTSLRAGAHAATFLAGTLLPLDLGVVLAVWALGLASELVLQQVRREGRSRVSLFHWLRGNRRFVLSLAADSLLQTGGSAAGDVGLGTASVPALGAVRTAAAPLNMVTALMQVSTVVLLKPMAAAVRSGRTKGAVALAAKISVTLASAALAVATAVWLIPLPAAEQLLGEDWNVVRPLVPTLAIGAAAWSAALGPSLLLRAQSRTKALIMVRLAALPVQGAGPVLGYVSAGRDGAAVGYAASGVVTALCLWAFVLTRNERRPTGSASSGSSRSHPSGEADPPITPS